MTVSFKIFLLSWITSFTKKITKNHLALGLLPADQDVSSQSEARLPAFMLPALMEMD